jgi:hypothetical protein
MTLYVNFRKEYSHRVDGISRLVANETTVTLLDKHGDTLAQLFHEWVGSYTKTPLFTCYTEDRIAAASQADTHPDKMVWSQDNGWHVKAW